MGRVYKTAPMIAHGDEPTTWVSRFSNVIEQFCNGRPPLVLVSGWFRDSDDGRLQDWVNERLKPSALWLQGIELIDAAERLADRCAEGSTHEERPADFTRQYMIDEAADVR